MYVKKSPEQLEMEKEVELQRLSLLYKEKDDARQQELELAKIDLEKIKTEISIPNRSKYIFKTVQSIFDVPVKLVAMFCVWGMVRKSIEVPQFLQDYLGGKDAETKT